MKDALSGDNLEFASFLFGEICFLEDEVRSLKFKLEEKSPRQQNH